MRPRRPVLLRTVGFLALGGLLVLNGWLVMLNLAKHDRLPDSFDGLPGLFQEFDNDDDDDPSGPSESGVGDGEAAAFNADGTVVRGTDRPGTIEVDEWPGGRGPVPDSPPVRRRVLVLDDGGFRLIGSAPDWATVTDLADAIERRLGLGPGTVAVDVTWHPEASPRLDDGDVELAAPLVYRPGQIDLPAGSASSLAAVSGLLAAHPELYVVVVGVVGVEASDEEAAVALGRTSVVAEDLAVRGIAADRVVSSVAPTDDSGEPAVTGDVVLVRIENLLAFGPGPTG